MLLHEFMNEHRDEILAACQLELRELHAQKTDGLDDQIAQFYDEMLHAVQRDQGLRESYSPLPAESATAARIGEDRQRAGIPVTQVPVVFAAISQAVGKTGEKYELTLKAEEYKLLNRCLDTGVATSIEKFWNRENDSKNQMLTESFGFIAHELRNALGNAHMAFRLLRTGGLDINGKTAEILARNLLRMEALVAQGLGSIKLQVGVEPVLTPVDVAAALGTLVASAIPDRGIQLALEVDDTVWVAADELLLTSAVSNLVHNAVKFSPANATVRVRVVAEADAARIEVEDQCGGLQAEPHEIFKPYVKQSAGNSSGTGLGLSIAKRAVEAMQGGLTVINRPGHGCVFVARLPLCAAPDSCS
jgi:K+-sensing histidine kinase KdpD